MALHPWARGTRGGQHLVLVPSLGTTAGLWRPAVERLLAQRPDLRVDVADLPGHGSGGAGPSDFAIEDVTDAVLALASADSGRVLSIAGVSFGGAVALDAARRHPDRISSFGMFNSSASFPDQAGWATLMARVAAQGTGSLLTDTAYGWFSPATLVDKPDLVRSALDNLAGVDDEGYLACCRALARFDAWVDLPQVDAPALVVAGSYDRTPTVATVRRLAEALPQARFAEMDGAHLAVLERPAGTAALLSDILHLGRDARSNRV